MDKAIKQRQEQIMEEMKMKILCTICRASFEVAKELEKVVFERGEAIVGPCGHKVSASPVAVDIYRDGLRSAASDC